MVLVLFIVDAVLHPLVGSLAARPLIPGGLSTLTLILVLFLRSFRAGLIVAAIACGEALAFVGLLVPGATLMIGAGALVGVAFQG